MHSPVFKDMLAECAGGGDATVPLIDDTLEGAKAFVKLCKIGVGEDATELKSITPRLLADALPFVHKYAAVGLGKFAREWFGHIVETTSHPSPSWFIAATQTKTAAQTKIQRLKAKNKANHLDDLSECFTILDNMFETEWTPAEIQWITGNTLGNRYVTPTRVAGRGSADRGGVKKGLTPWVSSCLLPCNVRVLWCHLVVTYRLHHRFDPPEPLTLRTPDRRCHIVVRQH
jgi:hypothetical protein